MSQPKETKKIKTIALRFTDEEYTLAESAAKAAGDDTNKWCRNLVLAQANTGRGMTKAQQVIFEEIARRSMILITMARASTGF